MGSGFGMFLLLQLALGIVVGIFYAGAMLVFGTFFATNPILLIVILLIAYLFGSFLGFLFLFRGRSFR